MATIAPRPHAIDGLRARPAGVDAIDRRALARELAHATSGEVRFSDGARALYANDGSSYRQVPLGVVVPRTLDDVVATVALCREFDAPVFARGAGTGLAGQTVNEAVLIDFSKYLRNLVEVVDSDGPGPQPVELVRERPADRRHLSLPA